MNQVNTNLIVGRKVDLKNKRKQQLEELRLILSDNLDDDIALIDYTQTKLRNNIYSGRIINIQRCMRNDET